MDYGDRTYPEPKDGRCPKCGGEVVDLRGAGFSARKFERDDARCYAWGRGTLTCRAHPPGTAMVVSEAPGGTWSYHLRRLEGRTYLGGGAPPAICGARLGWDTRIPLAAWGTVDHLPARWCSECATAAGLAPASPGATK